MLCIGIDLGGTKSAAVVGDPASGEILARVSAPTAAKNALEAVTLLSGLAEQARTQAGQDVAGIGISAGAPADASRGLVFDAPNLPIFGTEGFPLAAGISERLGLPAYLENDADATAFAEWRLGAGRGTQTMAFLTVGTGIGSGLILNGRLHRGREGAGGEIGHCCVQPGGLLCKCGLRGCLEAYASGPGIVRAAVENGFAGIESGEAVVSAARAGDSAANFAIEQAGEMLGRGLATLAMILNPERFVLGTLAVHAGDLLLPVVRQSLARYCWSRLNEGLEVVPAELGDRAQDLAALCVFEISRK